MEKYIGHLSKVCQKEEGKLESYIGKANIWKPRIYNDIKEQKKIGTDKENEKKALTHYKVLEKIGSQYSWLQL